MNDEFKEVEELFEAMRERGRLAAPLRPAGFDEVAAAMRRLRCRQRLHRGVVLLGIAALAVVAALCIREAAQVRHEPATAAGAPPPPAPPVAPPAAGTILACVEPFDHIVAFMDRTTRVDFAAPDRILLSAGSLALQIQPAPAPRPVIVETPAARVVVQGTVLRLLVGPDGTRVDVLHGKVEVVLGERTVAVGERERLAAGSLVPGPLPTGDAAELQALFPREQPCPTVAAAEAPAPDRQAATPERPAAASAPATGPRTPVPPSVPAESPDQLVDGAQLDDLALRAEEAMRARRWDDARELLEELLARVPAGGAREETGLYDRALVCEQLGDVACRRESLERYLERHPSSALREAVRLDLCRLFERSGPAEELEPCLRVYLSEFPEGRKAAWARELLGTGAPTTPPTD
ncbi:MAG: FecR domain-containing protein [Deltaproteobacteria bacterium]|nr:FecR domain-containing protein [Deltaproteobacteria bacterium]